MMFPQKDVTILSYFLKYKRRSIYLLLLDVDSALLPTSVNDFRRLFYFNPKLNVLNLQRVVLFHQQHEMQRVRCGKEA